MAQNNNSTLLIVAAIGAFLFMNKGQAAQKLTPGVPGATPYIPAYNQSPAFAGRAVQQQGAQLDSWGQLGSALGSIFSKSLGGPAASAGIRVPDVAVPASSDTSWYATNDTNVSSQAPGLPTVNPWADMTP